MWIIFHPKSFIVIRQCFTKSEAKALAERHNKKLHYWQIPLQIEKIEIGKLEEWLTWKKLTQVK